MEDDEFLAPLILDILYLLQVQHKEWKNKKDSDCYYLNDTHLNYN